ncbi:MAG: hypothetical protein LBC86_08265 [Oscillospiraceae bacterium]|jgi:hypothetical protein|nr:hypothetical protein [Oscillospiraceae bacterium]
MRKPACFLLCLIIIFTATACGYLDEIIHEVNRELAALAHLELIDDVREREERRAEEIEEQQEARRERAQESTQENAAVQQILDLTSPAAFTDSVWEQYGIILQDSEGLLYTDKGLQYKQEIEYALWLFSPEFMRKLADIFHKEYRATYIIRLGGHNDDQYGTAVWSNNVTVTLYLDNDPELCGITAPVLAHEIGHTIHYLVEEYIGEEQSELDMMSFNGDFDYVGDRYDRVWRYKLHGTTFAYDYSLYCYYEDIATVFELLVEAPDDMAERLSDPWNEPLLRKTQYIREMTYEYISDECYLVFMSLYEAEEILGLREIAA